MAASKAMPSRAMAEVATNRVATEVVPKAEATVPKAVRYFHS